VSTPASSTDPELHTQVLGTSTAATAEVHATLDLGTRLGRYMPIEELGRGGMGRVLRAYDPRLQREVALKVLHARAVDPVSRARLVREARTMAKLGHPNVVAVYDVDDDPRHGVMLAMELVEGGTLREWLRHSPRHWSEILAAFVEAGRGLAAAHAEGLLHRDFKPTNVLVAREGPVGAGGRGPCKVTDFGLAKLEHEQASSTSSAGAPPGPSSADESGEALTQDGTVLGTPIYMAPEQHHGEALTSAADQFSFCVSLWEALYGELPFGGDTRAEVVANIHAGKPRAPTRTGAVPGWLRRVCERGLALEPTQRWPSMGALLDTLAKGRTRARARQGLAAVGVLALLGAGWQAQRRWDLAQRTAACEATGDEVEVAWSTERKRALRSAIVDTGVSYASTTADKVMPWLDQQAEAWRDARVEACLDVDVRGQWDAETRDRSLWCLEERRMELGSLVDELTRADAELLPKAVMAAAALGSVAACRDARVLETMIPPPPEAREALRTVRADVVRADNLKRAGRYGEGLELARGALGRAEALEWMPLVAKARLQLGSLLERSGAYPEAEAELEQAYFDAARGVAPGVAFEAASMLVSVVGVSAVRPVEGRRWGRLAEVALEDVPDGEQLRRASLLINLGNLHHRSGAYEASKQHYEQALAIMEEALGPEHPHAAGYLNNLGRAHAVMGDHEAAKPLLERALAVQEQALGPEHPDVAASLSNLALMHYVLRRFDEAKRLHERSLAIREQALGPEHPDVAASLINLAAVYGATGAHDQSRVLFERALAITEKALGPEHPQVATCLSSLAITYQSTGRFDEAKALYERALAIKEKVLGPEHPELATSLNGLAIIHYDAGRYEAARVLFERALAIKEKALGPEHSEVAGLLENVALAHHAVGRHDEAKALLERALVIKEKALGPGHPDVGLALVGLAKVAIAQHRPGDAVRLAQRALTLREEQGVVVDRIAEARFTLARALWDAPADAGGDRARARALAEQARDALHELGEGSAADLAEAEAWLADHPGAP
jgi:tetratricopeptide (TPR) repeat protein